MRVPDWPPEFDLNNGDLFIASTACWRGYVGHWEIRDSKVYLNRVFELMDLRWDQIDFDQGLVEVQRLKNGTPSHQPLCGVELRALRRLMRDYPGSPFVFQSERGGPISSAGFRKLFARLGEKAELPWPINPHMLRHSTGYALVNKGDDTRSIQGFLGHKNIRHTQGYTALSAKRFQAMGLGKTLLN